MAVSFAVRSESKERITFYRYRQGHRYDSQSSLPGHLRDWHVRKSQFPHPERRRDSGKHSPSRRIHCPPPQQGPKATDPQAEYDISIYLNVEHANSRAFSLEHTPSGNSIISDRLCKPLYGREPSVSDQEAASLVQNNFIQMQDSPDDNQPERILRSLVESHEPMDDVALDGILSAANHVFFLGKLSGRVEWEWSHPSQERYQQELVGSTALRYAPGHEGVVETLIILSKPILRQPNVDRRLVLCAFLHELIHCFLFIVCGFKAREMGGHTAGFETIAGIIDEWVGKGRLQLCNMKADLDYYRVGRERFVGGHSHAGCNQSPGPDSKKRQAILVG
ncbi:hypothetical protein B0O99DRAFT_81168 [Bisporella sp. PMI_857]|nr:hypothetical protein B0O99DRAFT_81168 [Bisporella sp. PMI_857]